jgi:RND family efflux transporter MFP subunit
MSYLRSRSLVAAVLLSAAALAACTSASGKTAPEGAPAAATVRVARVAQEVLAPPVAATGTLGAKEEIALSFKIGGVIDRVLVDAGTVVRAGDTLAALDLREIDAAVARAQSAADKAERDLARVKRLYVDSVATLAQHQDAETSAEVARADLATARFNRRYAVILATAGGVILARRAESGELVAPGAPVLVLGSRARGAVVRVGLADRDAVRVRHGDPAVVHFDALEGREFTGHVTEIAAAAEPGTGTYGVEIALPEAAGLASGLVGQVEIRPSTGRTATLVPIEAVLEADGNQATVFALSGDGSRAERRRVIIAFLAGDRVAIDRGLEGVTAVITDGAAYLNDGAAVRVAP